MSHLHLEFSNFYEENNRKRIRKRLHKLVFFLHEGAYNLAIKKTRIANRKQVAR